MFGITTGLDGRPTPARRATKRPRSAAATWRTRAWTTWRRRDVGGHEGADIDPRLLHRAGSPDRDVPPAWMATTGRAVRASARSSDPDVAAIHRHGVAPTEASYAAFAGRRVKSFPSPSWCRLRRPWPEESSTQVARCERDARLHGDRGLDDQGSEAMSYKTWLLAGSSSPVPPTGAAWFARGCRRAARASIGTVMATLPPSWTVEVSRHRGEFEALLRRTGFRYDRAGLGHRRTPAQRFEENPRAPAGRSSLSTTARAPARSGLRWLPSPA